MYFEKNRNIVISIINFLIIGNIVPTLTIANALNTTSSVDDFAVKLYQNVLTPKTVNIVMSPISCQTILALAFTGSFGNTSIDMANALDLGNSTKQEVTDDFQNLLTSLTQVHNVTLTIANKIYIKDGDTINSSFSTEATDFGATVESINFTDTNSASKIINSWAANATDYKIQDLIMPQNIKKNTAMLLLNAIYFKGLWAHAFDKTQTYSTPFHVNANSTIRVNMMSVQNIFNYGHIDSLNCSVLQLPYQDPSTSMVFILPDKIDGLSALESALGSLNLNFSRQLTNQTVQVYIPRFTVNYEMQLNSALKELGMTVPFTSSADFSGMISNSSPLRISAVVQKVSIIVNEDGAEAAAVTDVSVASSSSVSDYPIFTADHPFLYMIMKDEIILFIGRYAK